MTSFSFCVVSDKASLRCASLPDSPLSEIRRCAVMWVHRKELAQEPTNMEYPHLLTLEHDVKGISESLKCWQAGSLVWCLFACS